MASDNQITIVGNLTDDPELRYTANGAAVANFRVAYQHADPRRGGQLDGRRHVVLHGQRAGASLAENAAETLTRGTRVVVTGRLQAAFLGEPGGREADRGRDRGRRRSVRA